MLQFLNLLKRNNHEINLSHRSSHFKFFYESVFGNRQNHWRDGPNIESLLLLDDYERKLAEKTLIDHLEKNDSFIFECVGILKSRKAGKYLRNIFPKCYVSLLPSCGLALWRIYKEESVISIIGMLLNHTDEFTKIDAVTALGQIDNQNAKSLLCKALTDDSSLVRYNALRYISGLEGNIEKLSLIARITSNESYNNEDSYHDKVSELLNTTNETRHQDVIYHGNHINIGKISWKVKYNILDLMLCEGRILMIYNYMQYLKGEVAHNLEAYTFDGRLIWTAENPEVGATDAYTNFYRGNLLSSTITVGNFAGYKCVINIKDGKLIKAEFTK